MDDLEVRLSTVARPFALILDVGTPTPAAAEALARIGTVVRLSPTAEPGSVLGDEERLPFGGRISISRCRCSLSRASTTCPEA